MKVADNFVFSIQCRDCGDTWTINGIDETMEDFPTEINTDKGKVSGRKKMVVLHVPLVCLSCRNLKSVPKKG